MLSSTEQLNSKTYRPNDMVAVIANVRKARNKTSPDSDAGRIVS